MPFLDWICPPRRQLPRSSIMAIFPYKLGLTWYFDDEDLGIHREAFVGGMSEIIDHIAEERGLIDPKNGFQCLFSATPFPDAQGCLTRSGEPAATGSAYYDLNGTTMRGWLCPCLLNFFPSAPETIYFHFSDL